jgi:hypothetical protein
MGHALRWFLPDTVYEITTRTIQGRMLLRPGEKLRRRIVGILARGQNFYDVKIYDFAVLSNHWQILLSAASGEALASFMGYVNSNIARECGRAHQWDGPFWGRRCRPIPCIDDAATLDRLKYCVAQGVKEGLVDHPLDWPGACGRSGLVGDMTLDGEWLNRDTFRPAKRAAAKRGVQIAEEAHCHAVTLHLSPLPVFAGLPAVVLQQRHQEIVDEITLVARRARRGAPSLGVAAILVQDPHGAPQTFAATPAPACHASTAKLRDGFNRIRVAMVNAYHDARAALNSALSMVRARTTRAEVRLGSLSKPVLKGVREPHTMRRSSVGSSSAPMSAGPLARYLAQIPPGMFACVRYFQPCEVSIRWSDVGD